MTPPPCKVHHPPTTDLVVTRANRQLRCLVEREMFWVHLDGGGVILDGLQKPALLLGCIGTLHEAHDLRQLRVCFLAITVFRVGPQAFRVMFLRHFMLGQLVVSMATEQVRFNVVLVNLQDFTGIGGDLVIIAQAKMAAGAPHQQSHARRLATCCHGKVQD